MMKKIENLKDWKPFLTLLDVGGFQESSNDRAATFDYFQN